MSPVRFAGLALALVLAPASAASLPAKPIRVAFLPPPLPGPRQLEVLDRYSHALLELDRARGRMAVPLLRRRGATLVSRTLEVWRLPSLAARRLVPQLERRGLLRSVEPDLPVKGPGPLTIPSGNGAAQRGLAGRGVFSGPGPLTIDGRLAASDPYLPDEWWIGAVGADQVEPPGPGKPITIIDGGIDVSHVEFSGRTNTILLNAQDFALQEELHGTAVASVAAAPANGVGIVGIYPQAVLRSWDASPGGNLTVSSEIAGIEAATAAGASVINLSIGSTTYRPLEEEAVLAASRRGSLVVAATGNELESGNPKTFPADLQHVLTVGSTGRSGNPSPFSSSSRFLDLVAPGEDIPVAVPVSIAPGEYEILNGTSFSAPIVSGAAAWVWTMRPNLDNTQVFDLLRFSARDIGQPGFDKNSGFGLLDIPAALTRAAPASDPQEPNDDIDQIKANGLFRQAGRPLTAPGRPSRTITARLDRSEDFEDVYRAWVPAHRGLVVSSRPNANVQLELWGPKTRTVAGESAATQRRDLLGASTKAGTRVDSVAVYNESRHGAFVYADCYLGKGVRSATYRLAVKTHGRP